MKMTEEGDVDRQSERAIENEVVTKIEKDLCSA